jgi:hypothetical protein
MLADRRDCLTAGMKGMSDAGGTTGIARRDYVGRTLYGRERHCRVTGNAGDRARFSGRAMLGTGDTGGGAMLGDGRDCGDGRYLGEGGWWCGTSETGGMGSRARLSARAFTV